MAVLAAPLLTGLVGAEAAGTIGTVLSVASTGFSALQAIQGLQQSKAQAAAQETSANYQAASMRQNAIQEEAIAQKKAAEVGRQGELMQSKALAQSAAGGGASDSSVVNAIGDLSGQTEYNKLMEIYNGKESAAGLNQGADLSQYEGANAARATRAKGKSDFYTGMGTVLSSPVASMMGSAAGNGAKSLYEKYAYGLNKSGYGNSAYDMLDRLG